ncbi:FAD-binding domain-containing protein [Microthyrium microscopicum]|uniref:FAD-binding domain-containing protein n=1 Tax=Microthyrium microscopicum TaxID=703497 RepID=A0A6A6U818_9PEZI|nr:FAD-binding domain-containing protein [Microthyrium microscopicum]
MASFHVIYQALAIWTLIISLCGAKPTTAASETCDEIAKAINNNVGYPGEPGYDKENRDYYNSGLSALGPACIAFPTSAEDVSSIVKILGKREGVPFAVKSGGHSPNPGHSSVSGGVLIALREIKGTKFDKAKSIAYVKPGGHWWDVMKALNGTGQMIVGGRLGVVGIGGYLLQGGVSFLSGQYGLAADNIVEYETVLANGSIVNINQERHKDLMTAMRGSGSQFGIVTKFALKTYPVSKYWVGLRTYNCTREQYLEALQDFMANLANHPKASTLLPGGSPGLGNNALLGSIFKGLGSLSSLAETFGSKPKDVPKVQRDSTKSQDMMAIESIMGTFFGTHLFDYEKAGAQNYMDRSAANSTPSLFPVPLLYDGCKPPSDAFGKKFAQLPMISEVGSIVDYATTISVSNQIFEYFSTPTSFRTFTLPIIPHRPYFIGEVEDLFYNVSMSWLPKLKSIGSLGLVYQPFPHSFGKHAEASGGNAMGLKGSDHDRFVLEIPGVYISSADAPTMQAWGKDFTDRLAALVKDITVKSKAEGKIVGEYNPLFMNDAGTDQEVIGSYRDSQKFAALQKEVDPSGLFAKRAGGYKFATLV